MKCFHPETKYAVVGGERISIQDYQEGTPYCINEHELIGVKGHHNEWHFRHKHTSDVRGELTEWHKEWQRHFQEIEVGFNKLEGQTKSRRADIVEGNYVVEIQHSSITREEVDQRNFDYSLHHKNVLWVVDGSTIQLNGDVLTIDSIWKFSSFIHCDFIYINIGTILYKVIPQMIKSLTVHVSPIFKDDFIHSIKTGTVDKWVVPCQSKLFVKQQGAGNGKTWGIIQMLAREDFIHYKHFIYVTKQHSARVIIKEEFRTQQSSLGFSDVSEIKEDKKKFIIHYKNHVQQDCTIVIATIDSFMYSIGDKQVTAFDKFTGIVQSIVEGHLEVKDVRGTIQYASINPKLNAETLYIIDEAQDLKSCYAEAMLEVMKKTNMDVYVVGDKLQSISNEINAFSVFQTSPYAIVEEPSNICRRFIDPDLVDFVNHMVPFEKHNLHPVSPYKVIPRSTTPSVIPILAKSKGNTDEIEDRVDKIMFEYNKQVEEHGYMPENFLVVVPFVSTNPFANILDVAINHYWNTKLTPYYIASLNDDYWRNHNPTTYYRYSIFHKSEEGSSINLDESARSTRIVSIHASKGDGREVVFVVGIDEHALKRYSGIKDTLIYDSLLHVAITRMKRTLYIVYGEDEIGRKIKEWLRRTGEVFEIENISISNVVSVVDILRLKGDALNQMNDQTFDEETCITELIDMGHHNIRYGILIEKISDLLRNERFDKMQIATQHSIAYNRPISKCYNWKDYNKHLLLNKLSILSDKKDVSIPLLYTNDQYKKYNIKIEKIIKNIKYKCNGNKELCPLELIVFYYMKQITQHHFNTRITIIELYTILHVYEKSYQHHLKGHDMCCCKALFVDNSNGNTLTDYLITHYQQMIHVNLLLDVVIQTHPNTSWNTDHSLTFSDTSESFKLKSKCAFIGYNETEVVLLYIKPTLNTLNFNEIKARSMLDMFLIKNTKINTPNYEKYNQKKINVYIIATNLSEPYVVSLNEKDPTPVIADAIYDNYVLYNHELYYFYLQYRKKMDYKTFLVQWDKIKTDTESKCPRYIDDFMTNMKHDSKRGRIPNDDLDSIFLYELNNTLRENIAEFLI